MRSARRLRYVKNAQSILKPSDSVNRQIGLFHALISANTVGAVSHKARLVTAPATGCERAPAGSSCSDRWRRRGLYFTALKIREDMVEHVVSGSQFSLLLGREPSHPMSASGLIPLKNSVVAAKA
jgi:hypothetical protein